MTGGEILDFLERIERHKTPTYSLLIKKGIFHQLRNIVKVDIEYEKISPEKLKRRTPELIEQFHQLLLEEKLRDIC